MKQGDTFKSVDVQVRLKSLRLVTHVFTIISEPLALGDASRFIKSEMMAGNEDHLYVVAATNPVFTPIKSNETGTCCLNQGRKEGRQFGRVTLRCWLEWIATRLNRNSGQLDSYSRGG